MEHCVNCKSQIGELEIAHVYRDQIVCSRCAARLKSSALDYASPRADLNESEPARGVIGELREEIDQLRRQRRSKPKNEVGCFGTTVAIVIGVPLLLCGCWSFILPKNWSGPSNSSSYSSPPTPVRSTVAALPSPLFGDNAAMVAFVKNNPPDEVVDVKNNGYFIRKDAVYRGQYLAIGIVPDLTDDPPRRWRVARARSTADGRFLSDDEALSRLRWR